MEEFDVFFENNDSDEEIPILNRAPKRYIRDLENPLEAFDDIEFQRRYRFRKNCVTDVLLPLVQHQLDKNSNRGLPIPTIFQLLLALRFYGSNSFQVNTCEFTFNNF